MGGAFLARGGRRVLAAALDGSGRGLAGCRSHEASLAIFREAEAMQKERQPKYPMLYSLGGYAYCDLLLEEFSVVSVQSSGRDSALKTIREVRDRAETVLKWFRNRPDWGILDFALDHLTLGRTYLLETRYKKHETSKKKPEKAEASALGSDEHHLNEVVALLRQCGQQ